MDDHIELTVEEKSIIEKDTPMALFLTGCHLARLRIIKDELDLALLTRDLTLVQLTADRLASYVNGVSDAIYRDRENEQENQD